MALQSMIKLCLAGYTNLVGLSKELSTEKAHEYHIDIDHSREVIISQSHRFHAWASHAAKGGQLEKASTTELAISSRIPKVLEAVISSLEEAAEIFLGVEINEIWNDGWSSDSEKENPSVLSMEEYQAIETTSLKELLLSLNSANTTLAKLAILSQNSPANDDYLRAATRYNLDPRYDIGHVREKHPECCHWLVERLGKAITRRRKFLKYRQEHLEKSALEWDINTNDLKVDDTIEPRPAEAPSAMRGANKEQNVLEISEQISDIEDPDTDIASEAGDSEFASFGSQTSYEATVGEEASNGLAVPPHPEWAFEGVSFSWGEPFLCPYCHTEQCVKSKSAWKKHVFQDLRPYVCTFRECNLRMFRSRNEWFAHELKIHRREWICPYCEKVFDNKGDFGGHLIPSHPGADPILMLSDDAVTDFDAAACKLCNDWSRYLTRPSLEASMRVLNEGRVKEPRGTLKQFRRHLGRHMEQLALFALPISEVRGSQDDSSWDDDDDLSQSVHNERLERHQSGDMHTAEPMVFEWRQADTSIEGPKLS